MEHEHYFYHSFFICHISFNSDISYTYYERDVKLSSLYKMVFMHTIKNLFIITHIGFLPCLSQVSQDLLRRNTQLIWIKLMTCQIVMHIAIKLKDLQPKLQHQSQQCKGVGNEVACLMITLSYVSIEMVKGIYFRMKILDA